MRRAARLALITAVGLMCAWLEFMFIPDIAVPGVKLGFANIATLMALYMYGAPAALGVCVSRVLLAAFLFGSAAQLIYALSGALAALGVMALLRRCGAFSEVGVSAAGGVAHNMAQLAAAALVAQTPGLLYYLPVLVIAGTLTGALNGYLVHTVLKRVSIIK